MKASEILAATDRIQLSRLVERFLARLEVRDDGRDPYDEIASRIRATNPEAASLLEIAERRWFALAGVR